jgi:hypothetical protein
LPGRHLREVKAADIPVEVFLEAVRLTRPMHPGTCWRVRHDVQALLEIGLDRAIPEKVFPANPGDGKRAGP